MRAFTTNVPIRGRHRLVNVLSNALGSGIEHFKVGDFIIEIDHSIEFCRNIYYGLYEEHLVNFLADKIRPGDVVVDPGANIGYITACALRLVGKEGQVVSLEPSRTCFTQLVSNNEIDAINNLTLLNAAVGNKTGVQRFYDTPRVVTRGYACLEQVNTPRDGEGYDVRTWTIDDLCKDRGIDHIRFLKLDIEGAERIAIEGSSSMLSKGAIDYLLIETFLHPDRPQGLEDNKQIIASLRAAGYRPFAMRRSGALTPFEFDLDTTLRTDLIWSRPNLVDNELSKASA